MVRVLGFIVGVFFFFSFFWAGGRDKVILFDGVR